MTNNKVILITRPNDDPILNFLFYWSEVVVLEAKKKNCNLLDLKGDKANREYLESYVKKNNPTLLLFNGHGSHSSIFGQNSKPIIELGVNDYLLKGKIVYARSCDSAKTLGLKCDAKSFIGYQWNFVFYYSLSNTTHPLKDKIAQRFLEPSNIVCTTLLKGGTSGEAHNRSRDMMLKNYFEMVSSKGTFEEQRIASFLWGNIAGQRLYGDKESHI